MPTQASKFALGKVELREKPPSGQTARPASSVPSGNFTHDAGMIDQNGSCVFTRRSTKFPFPITMAKKKTAPSKTAGANIDPYDAIPYVGRPRPLAHPDDLATRAHLFGLTPPPVETARVLEIGCADGANLHSIAASLPKSVCVGIDRSASQIAEGEKIAKSAALKNVFLGELDFRELPEKPDDTYDYIIAHGIYSWIDADAQTSLIEKIRSHLSPHGVAFVSYNCYPGWHLRQMVREFLLYHTAGIDDPQERVNRCRDALPGLIQSVPPQLQGYAALLVEEQQLIERTSDDYIAHEHLEENNRPCYFHEFASRLEENGLQFLCEAELASMQANRYPQVLGQLAGHGSGDAEGALDPIKAEQYLDFSRLRMFRQTLIVHADVEVKRQLEPARVRELSASAYGVYKEEQAGISDQAETFQGEKGVSITTAHPLSKAAMRVLAENWPNRLPFAELESFSRSMFSSEASTTAQTEEIEKGSSAIAEMLLAGATAEIVNLHISPARYTTSVSEKPVASQLARAQADVDANVTTLRHRSLTLSSLGQHMIKLLDGKHDHAKLADAVIKLVEDGKFVLQENGLAVSEADDRSRLAKQQVSALLDQFAKAGLLVE